MPLSKATTTVRNAVLTLSAMSLFVGCTSTPKTVEASPVEAVTPATSQAATMATTVAVSLGGPPTKGDAPAAAPSTAPAGTMATAGDVTITSDELMKPLVEAYGLTMLMQLVKLQMVENQAAKLSVTVTSEQVAAETTRALRQGFKDATEEEYPQLLEKLYADGKFTRAEFEMAMRTNALLRQMALPQVRGKVTEENVREAFDVLYGARREVRHIAVRNLPDVIKAQSRLKAGEPFEAVARTMSVNVQSRAVGGLLPEFSQKNATMNPAFVQAAFALENIGDVSEPVQAEDLYHLIKLEKKLEPRVVKFEDVRGSVRADLEDRIADEVMKAMLAQIGQRVLKEIHIEDPELAAQFKKKVEEANAKPANANQVRENLNRGKGDPAVETPRLTPKPMVEMAPSSQPAGPPQ